MSNVSQILFRSDKYLVKTVDMLISKLLLYECHTISDMWAWGLFNVSRCTGWKGWLYLKCYPVRKIRCENIYTLYLICTLNTELQQSEFVKRQAEKHLYNSLPCYVALRVRAQLSLVYILVYICTNNKKTTTPTWLLPVVVKSVSVMRDNTERSNAEMGWLSHTILPFYCCWIAFCGYNGGQFWISRSIFNC